MNSERKQLKRATELLVRSVGGIEAAAAILGRGHSTVGRWVNRNDDDHYINIADLAELEANASDPTVTSALARLTGHGLSSLTQSETDADAIPMQLMELLSEVGELCTSINAGFADQRFCRKDASKALDELHDVEGCISKLNKVLGQIAASGAKLEAVA